MPKPMDPPAVSGAEKELRDPVVISRRVPGELAAGNCVRIEGGTVKVCAPAVVIQMNETEVVTPAAIEPVLPMISKESDEFPPVQLSVSPWLRTTVAGRPPVTTKGLPKVDRGGELTDVLYRRLRSMYKFRPQSIRSLPPVCPSPCQSSSCRRCSFPSTECSSSWNRPVRSA